MPVYRMDKQSNYIKVGNYFIRDPDLSLRGKGMLTLLLSLPEDWQYSIAGLSFITKEGEDAPYIKRTVDGREYTVKIHFHPDSHETAKEKLKRVMVNDIQSGILQEETSSECGSGQ